MAPCFLIFSIVVLLQFNLINTYRDETVAKVKDETTYEGSANKANNSFICKKKVCVPKCCPLNEYVINRTCGKYVFTNDTLDFSDMGVHNKGRTKLVSTVNKTMHLVPGKFKNETFHSKVIKIWKMYESRNLYLTVLGDYYSEIPNMYDRWTRYDTSQICIDYQIENGSTYTKPMPRVWVAMRDQSMQNTRSKANKYINIYGDLISSIFLLLVFIVYVLLPELRNMGGKVLMCYVFSLLWAYLILFVINIKRHPVKMCTALALIDYFFFLSSFCWMNVMSYDIWTTFRCYTKSRLFSRRGERCKLLIYCLYAWGIPLLMTIFVSVMNFIPMKEWPWVVTPNIGLTNCFLADGSMFLYLYIPMAILILANFLFFLMTAFNVWRLNRGTRVLVSSAAGTQQTHRKQSRRFMIYVKLSVVMGLSWVFEVTSWCWPEFVIWDFTDIYNAIIGFTIFVIFVCKKKIFTKLKLRFSPSQVDDNSEPSTENTRSIFNNDDNEVPITVVNLSPVVPKL